MMFGFKPHIESMVMGGTFGGGFAPTTTTQQQTENPDTRIVNGVTYTHIGSGVYQSPWGEFVTIGEGIDPITGFPTGIKVDPLPADLQPWNAPGAGGSGYPPAHLDPRYWAIQYAQLAQQAQNSGLDAESARQQALSTLIANRNAQQVNLAGTYGNIAAQAAKFASAPEDTYADLLYRNAVGGATPFGAMSANPEAAGARKTALEAKFQELFGPAAAALGRAGEFISSPPPAEFYGPEIRVQLGLPPTSAQSLAGSGGAGSPAPAPFDPAAVLQAARAGAGSDENFLEGIRRLSALAPPATAEDGINMNIMEPAMIVGKSGRIYATMSEKDPEQLIVKPLPSVKERQRKEKEQGKNFMKATQGAERMEHGGTVNSIPDFSDLFRETRTLLSNIGGAYGGIGEAGRAGTLPDVRLLAGAPYEELSSDPHLLAQVMSGYRTAEGGAINPQTFLSMIKKFGMTAPSYNSPKLSFA